MKTYMSIKETARETGLSQYFLRRSVKEGIIPHITSGNRVLINVPKMLEELDSKVFEEEE